MPTRASLLLLVGLALSGGCTTLPTSSPDGNGGESPFSMRLEGNASKRQPKPATYVAYGELHEKAATDPGRSSAEQHELRGKARLAYQQALQICPNDLGALMALARLYTSEGDYEQAVASYNRAIQAYPKDAAPRFELGMCHARRKNWDLALLNMQKAVEADPDNHSYRHTYGLCLARAGRSEESFAVLAKLEGPANAHYELARMLHHLEQDEASKAHLRQALAQNPEHFAAQQFLAALESGNPDLNYPTVPAGMEYPEANSSAALGRPVRVVGQ